MALATIANYETITGTTVAVGAETTRITSLLAITESAILAGAHGQNIASATYTGATIRPIEGVGLFPQRPVTAVASVSRTQPGADAEVLTANTDYRWTAGGNRSHARLYRVVDGRDAYWLDDDILTVTYTAGWSTIPGQIIAGQVAMVKGIVSNGGSPAFTQTAAGPFSGTITPGDVQSAALALPPATQAVLDQLCGVDAPTSVAVKVG